ncbi:DUF3592 domain-containing protein [Massilia sp. PAMC28688]|uniref:DUF3592 domain-containing protein n=1 Tax=Massilia sp. PAMC28688 TaxID=2861283 RepID=UPI001C62BAE0|nr:DUF3592 domain-containing protein [Massilia sp. PAMC28688]QYF95477.1 DUF3592 domain-containing protein [Massilia sp. PAMC28688]
MLRPHPRRWAVALFVLLFSGGFVLLGALVGMLPLHDQAAQWYAQRAFVPVPARVEAVRLMVTPHAKADQHFQVMASLSYQYQGRTFQVRGSTSQRGDTFRAYHEKRYSELEQARRQASSVPLWINPDNPEQVTLDRGFRWLVALLSLPLALGFPLVGLGASAALVWLSWPAPAGAAPRKIKPVRLVCFFALVWNALTLPFCLAKLYDSLTEHAYGLIPVLLVFPVIGLLLANWARRLWRQQRQLHSSMAS